MVGGGGAWPWWWWMTGLWCVWGLRVAFVVCVVLGLCGWWLAVGDHARFLVVLAMWAVWGARVLLGGVCVVGGGG